MPGKDKKLQSVPPSILDTQVVRLFANILSELIQALVATGGINCHMRARLNILLYRLVRLLSIIGHAIPSGGAAQGGRPKPDSTS